MSSNAIKAFRSAIDDCRMLCQTGVFIENNAKIIDSSECYRAAIALSVSALDFYVHSIIVERALEIYTGKRAATKSTSELTLSLTTIIQSTAQVGDGWLAGALQASLKRKTFQKSGDISKGIAQVYEGKLWPEIAALLGESAENTKKKLDVITSKRDVIVHEADIDMSNFPLRNAVAHTDADYAVCTIIKIVDAMDALLA